MEGKVKAFEILQFNVSDISVELMLGSSGMSKLDLLMSDSIKVCQLQMLSSTCVRPLLIPP